VIPIQRLNKFASLSIIPLMALAIVIGSRAVAHSTPKAPMPNEGLLVIAQLRGEALTTYDFANGGAQAQLALPGPPHEFAYAGGRLYLTLGRGNQLLELAAGVPTVLRSLELTGEPNGLGVSGDNLVATLDKGDALVTIDRGSMTETGRVTTGDTPHNVAVTSEGAYVTVSRENALAFIPVSNENGTAATVQTQPSGLLPESVAITGGFIVTADADGGTITIVRRDPFETVGTLAVGGRPVRVIALDGTHVLVSLNNDAQVAVVDVAAHHVERRIAVLGHPDGLCLSPNGAYVAVSSNEAGKVQIFRRSDWALAGTVEAGDGPGACTWIPSH
jgi:DNA-binding beta-propeller fold protein YncE